MSQILSNLPKIFENPRFWNLKLDFFHLRKFFKFSIKYGKSAFYKLTMTKVSSNLQDIFWTQNTPTFESWSWIFFRIKIVFTKFRKFGKFLFFSLIMSEVSAKLKNFFVDRPPSVRPSVRPSVKIKKKAPKNGDYQFKIEIQETFLQGTVRQNKTERDQIGTPLGTL